MDYKKRTEVLANEEIGKLIIRFSTPAIIGMLVMASYSFFDRIFVGRGVGSLAISAITIVFPIIMLYFAFGMLIGIGSTSRVSLALGEKNKEEAEKILGNSISLSFIISSIVTLIFYFYLMPIIKIFGGTGDVALLAYDFAKVGLIGFYFQIFTFSLNAIIRGEGNPKTAMITMIISSIINITLNPLFIFVFHWGIRGSAWATVIAQIFSFTWILFYFFSKKSLLKIHFKYLKIDKRIVKSIVSIGVSPFAMQLAGGLVLALFNKVIGQYGGEHAIAAMGIGISVSFMIMMPIFGLNQGIQPILGYNYGAKNFHRVKETLKKSIILATAICTLGFLIVELFTYDIVNLFVKNDPMVLNYAIKGLRIFMLVIPIIGFQIIITNYFQSVGKAKHSLILTMSRQIIFLIPLLLILPRFFSMDGVWFSGPISDTCSSILAAVLLFNERKNLNESALKASI